MVRSVQSDGDGMLYEGHRATEGMTLKCAREMDVVEHGILQPITDEERGVLASGIAHEGIESRKPQWTMTRRPNEPSAVMAPQRSVPQFLQPYKGGARHDKVVEGTPNGRNREGGGGGRRGGWGE